MLRAAGRDERLSTGQLYLDAADEIERLTRERDELYLGTRADNMQDRFGRNRYYVGRKRIARPTSNLPPAEPTD
jgi:hypothetical protein